MSLSKGWHNVGNTTKPGNHLWDEMVNFDTGESTLQIHVPKTIMTSEACDHYFVEIDRNRNVQCRECSIGTKIVFPYELKDGKIVKFTPNTPKK